MSQDDSEENHGRTSRKLSFALRGYSPFVQWLQLLLGVCVIGFLVYRLNAIGWAAIWHALPRNLWFYALFAVWYLAIPLSECFIYRRLWNCRLGHPLPILLRKRVLNFGVLGRITWLDRQGKEGLLGLETGVLGASLIPQQYNNSPAFPPTLVTLLGLGLRVEVGQGAAVGVHLWGAYEFRSAYAYTPPDASGPRNATHWSLLFGPSISIGNVGTNL